MMTDQQKRCRNCVFLDVDHSNEIAGIRIAKCQYPARHNLPDGTDVAYGDYVELSNQCDKWKNRQQEQQ